MLLFINIILTIAEAKTYFGPPLKVGPLLEHSLEEEKP